MELYRWDDIEAEPITDLLTRRYLSGDRVTLARFFLKKGCLVQAHSHENEQMSTVITGALKFVVEGNEIVVRANETLHIPAFSAHSAEALEDSDVFDVFSPPRSDWIEGRADYLRGK
ncbi:MAG TPA: cupin domain-containing protein [Blastocatellia bacterium]|nr:cupin domain-containing protein [Blastocatellia bacterium]